MLRAVVLVLKFADDLLDGVLDGDQSGDAAVFDSGTSIGCLTMEAT